MEYKRLKDRLLVKLERGDDMFPSLYDVIKKEKINFAWINGIGAFEEVSLGAYCLEKKDYIKSFFNGHYEIVSLQGNCSIKDKEPFLHIHATISDEKCHVFAGHLFSAVITLTCELVLFLSDAKINRVRDDDIGLSLWDLNNVR